MCNYGIVLPLMSAFHSLTKIFSNFERKDNLCMSLKVRETTQSIRSVVKWVSGRAGPGQYFSFFKFKSNHHNIYTLFSDSKILLKCWTEQSLKDLMWNIKYFSRQKNCKLCCCVSFHEGLKLWYMYIVYFFYSHFLQQEHIYLCTGRW